MVVCLSVGKDGGGCWHLVKREAEGHLFWSHSWLWGRVWGHMLRVRARGWGWCIKREKHLVTSGHSRGWPEAHCFMKSSPSHAHILLEVHRWGLWGALSPSYPRLKRPTCTAMCTSSWGLPTPQSMEAELILRLIYWASAVSETLEHSLFLLLFEIALWENYSFFGNNNRTPCWEHPVRQASPLHGSPHSILHGPVEEGSIIFIL